ncbi:hypothetical protein FA13DRAFT_1739865 [Coprinellus micaceus]|uniref:Uncharacterized protein n=1 Tax=Coprinellus micaceus TaxID=71717 RepID=A0A4Y7SP84_COPMI|nr:hypothetical protein FA13DRAFT_1739865 [Coprinellus micaceus]
MEGAAVIAIPARIKRLPPFLRVLRLWANTPGGEASARIKHVRHIGDTPGDTIKGTMTTFDCGGC